MYRVIRITETVNMLVHKRYVLGYIHVLIVQDHCHQIIRRGSIIRTEISGFIYKNTQNFVSHSTSSPHINKNGGEIPRHSVDQGLSTSPNQFHQPISTNSIPNKNNFVKHYKIIFCRMMKTCHEAVLDCFWLIPFLCLMRRKF